MNLTIWRTLTWMSTAMLLVSVAWAQTTQPAAAPAETTAATKPVAAGPVDVFDAIPTDARCFIVVRDMQALSNSITQLGQQLGLPVPPALPMIKMMTQLLVGVDDTGSCALVLVDSAVHPMPLGLLVPVTDVTQMLLPLAPQDAGDGVQQIMLMNKPTFVLPYGRFVVMAPSKEVAQQIVSGSSGVRAKLNEARLAAYEKCGIFVHVDVAPLIKKYKPMIEAAMPGVPAPQTAGQPNEAEVALVSPLTPAFDFFEQVDSADLVLNLDMSGLTLTAFMQFLPGTEMAQQMAAQQPTDQPLMLGLPLAGEQYVLAIGQTYPDSQAYRAAAATSLDKAFANPQVKTVFDPEKTEQLKKSLLEMTGLMRGASFSISGLEGADGLFGFAMVWEVSDAARMVTLLGDLVNTVKDAIVHEQAKQALQHLLYKPLAEQLGELVVDHILMDLAGLEEVTAEDKELFKQVLGQDVFLVRLAPVGKQHVVMAFGGGAERFTNICKLAAEGKSPLSSDPGIMRIAGKLAKSKTAEGYFALDHLVQLIVQFAEKTGRPVPIQAMQKVAPVGFATTGQDDWMRMDVFVPMELIVAVKNLIMQAMAGPPSTQPTTAPPVAPAPVPAPTF
jgi:hypothetical protein